MLCFIYYFATTHTGHHKHRTRWLNKYPTMHLTSPHTEISCYKFKRKFREILTSSEIFGKIVYNDLWWIFSVPYSITEGSTLFTSVANNIGNTFDKVKVVLKGSATNTSGFVCC